jgi:hypothetical protein
VQDIRVLAVTRFSTTSQFCKKRRRTGRKGEREVRESGFRVSLRAWRERERERELRQVGLLGPWKQN